MFFLLSDAVLLVGKLAKIVLTPTPQTLIIAVGWIVLVAVTGMATYGTYHGRKIAHAAYTVQVEKDTSLEKLNLVLIADTHLGYQNDERWLAKLINEINTLEPDIVVIAGDIFNDNFKALTNPDGAVRLIQSIKSTYGVFAVLGNHDGGNTYDAMLNFLEESHVTLLQDDYLVIEDKFIVVGRSDPSPIGGGPPSRKDTSIVLAGIDVNMPVIALEHQIVSIDEYIGTADLILAGHTHRGQMFPGNIVTRLTYEVDYGHYQRNVNSPHVVVTSGAGVWGPPFRIGTNTEVVSVMLEFR